MDSFQNTSESSVNVQLTATTFTAVLFACGLISIAGALPVILFGKFGRIDERTLRQSLLLRCLLHFSVGTLLFDSLCHILPEAVALTPSQPQQILFRTILGILTFFSIEKFAHLHEIDNDESFQESKVFISLPKSIPETPKKMSRKGNFATFKEPVSDSNNNLIRPKPDLRLRSISLSDNPPKITITRKPAIEKSLKTKQHETAAKLNLLANTMDNFNHGLSVGTAFLISYKCGFLASFSILLHEIPHEFGDFAILLRSGKTVYETAWCQLRTATSSFIGGMVALCVCSRWQETACSWLLPLSAGGFIYVALTTILADLEVGEFYKSYRSPVALFCLEIACTLSGVGTMYWSMQLFN